MSEPQRIDKVANEAIQRIKDMAQETTMALTDEEVLYHRVDAEMMRRPRLWPTDGLLPLKRKKESGGLPQVAVLRLDRSSGTEVFEVHENMSMMGVSFDGEVIVHRYEDPESILMEGWIVD